MKVKYQSNNSGGDWWLSDKNWHDLEKGGWVVDWKKDEKTGDPKRWLGALATKATKEAESVEAAREDWERITGMDSWAFGCPCCGEPHYFSEATA